ncbi:hypothetical protein C2G38_2210153 [Gigaspora rosea]|uniref:Uncharacterized protein n=1 Tax=Gigaspora rosea TaxID=44941 RepID=A0A397UFA4_9GLOM|nr:hypothetical protein C2G38_2210153 [Gigaspora rosea]
MPTFRSKFQDHPISAFEVVYILRSWIESVEWLDYDEIKKLWKCERCNQNNTSEAWCQTCDSNMETQGLASGTKNVDNYIKEFPSFLSIALESSIAKFRSVINLSK